MLAEERFSLILDLLARQRTATVQELCEALSASESTIRRDLNELGKQGKLNKVHGGATLPDSPFRTDEPTMAAKEELAVSQKQSIAQAAAELDPAGRFHLSGCRLQHAGSGTALSGPALNASYVTNGVAHARLLAQKGCRVFLPGGLLRPPDRGHHRGGCTDCHPAVQFHQSVHGGQWRGAGFRLYHPRPRGGRRQGCGSPSGTGDVVPGGRHQIRAGLPRRHL